MTRHLDTPRGLRARRARRGAAALALVGGATVALGTAPVGAQGTLSGQGFGYPTGQLSTRSLGSGGAMAELDPLSPLNPSAVAGFGRSGVFFQYDPEFRRVEAGGASQSSTLTRFPVIGAVIPAFRRAHIGLSASTLLDRTFATTRATESVIGGESVTATERIEARGSVTDLRVAFGYFVAPRLRVGVAGHVLTGENRFVQSREFPDTSRFGSVSDTSNFDYRGVAGSAGVAWEPVRGINLGASYRKGGDFRTERRDSTLTSATAPDRMGVALRVDRITGASIGASWARQRWSNLRGLGSEQVSVRDGTELAVGAEAVGPRWGNNSVLLRLGGRRRDLPFGVGGADVRETAFAAGLGVPLASGGAVGFERAMFDLAIQRASRTPLGGALDGASERAWTVSFGFAVRP